MWAGLRLISFIQPPIRKYAYFGPYSLIRTIRRKYGKNTYLGIPPRRPRRMATAGPPCSLHATRSAARPAGGVGRGRVCARGRVRLRERGRLRPCNEATLSRPRAQARRARALEKVNAFVSRRGLAFSPPISPPISPSAISEQQVQVDNEVFGLAAAAAGFSAANPLARAAGFDARGLFHRDVPRRSRSVSQCCR